jgi:hypothetical protein
MGGEIRTSADTGDNMKRETISPGPPFGDSIGFGRTARHGGRIVAPVVAVLFACSDEVPGPGESCSGLRLVTEGGVAVIEEAGTGLALDALDGCGSRLPTQSGQWSSSNTRILTVTVGVVTGVSAGKPTLRRASLSPV